MKNLISILTISVVACIPSKFPEPSTTDDAGVDAGVIVDASDDAPETLVSVGVSKCTKACKTLSDLGCPESKIPPPGDCVSTCIHMQNTRGMDMRPECVAASKSVSEVRKCGTVRCELPSK